MSKERPKRHAIKSAATVSIQSIPPAAGIGNKERVSVLLAEYSTLRAGVLSALDNVTKAIGIGTPAFLGLIGLNSQSLPQSWLLGLAIVVIAVMVAIAIWNDRNTRAFTKRLRTIEKAVNELVGGEPLLVWETDYGWGSIFPPKSNPDYKGYRTG